MALPARPSMCNVGESPARPRSPSRRRIRGAGPAAPRPGDAPRERRERFAGSVPPASSAAGTSRALSPRPLPAVAVIVAPSRCQQRSAAPPALPGRTGALRSFCCCKYEPPIPSPLPLPDRRVAAVKLPRGAFGNTPVPGFLPQICMTTSRGTERATPPI